eukprot:scaffold1312_cov122-Cylindrotheca_fusiformis.AAC.4
MASSWEDVTLAEWQGRCEFYLLASCSRKMVVQTWTLLVLSFPSLRYTTSEFSQISLVLATSSCRLLAL